MKNNKNITLLLLCCYGLTTACHNLSTRKEMYHNTDSIPSIPEFKKTKYERTYGGTTVYFEDQQGNSIHAHTGGRNQVPYYNLVTAQKHQGNQVKYKGFPLDELVNLAPKDIDKRIRLCGIVADRTDLFNAPFTPIGPYGYFGSQLIPKKYEKAGAEINARYAEATGQDMDYVPLLDSRPLYKKALYCIHKALARQAFHQKQIKQARFHFAAMSAFNPHHHD